MFRIATLTAVLAAVASSEAATLFETTEVLADSANQALLTEPKAFTVSTAGTYTLELKDLQTPAKLGSLKAIVTRDLKVVGQTAVIYPTSGNAALTPATVTFDAPVGNYRVHVVGTVQAGQPPGLFSMKVTAADGTTIVSQAGSISPGPASVSGESILQTKFDIAQAGDYDLTLTDQVFPAALASSNMLLLDPDSAPVVLTPPGRFTAVSGTYELFVIAHADATTQSGLYSVSVKGVATGAVAYASTQPVGQLSPAALLTIASAGSYDLTLTDAKFPSDLASLSAVVVQQNAIASSMLAAGTASLALVPGDLQIYVQATPVVATGVGAFKLRLAQGATIVDARTQIVDASPDAGTPAIYSFASRSPVAAGPRRLTLKDFAFPQAFTTLKAVVVQGDTVSALRDASGTLDVDLRAEPVTVLVAGAVPTNGLFGMTLATQSLGAVDIESTQGVGGLFKPQTVQITTQGRYDLTLADLQFPAALRTSALAITRGTTLIGQIFGSGVIPGQQLDPGVYVLNFLGQPALTSSFGSYGLKVADAPAAPVITFTASPTSLRAGEQATLQWSATNATACTASGGWSGTRAVSGSVQSAALQATTSFDLACSGPGGNTSSSVTVTVSAARSKGGGGALDLWMIACLAGAMGAARLRRHAVPRGHAPVA
jgi:hypothetical protein